MTFRAAVHDQYLVYVGHSEIPGINGHSIRASTDRALNGWSAKVLLHDFSLFG